MHNFYNEDVKQTQNSNSNKTENAMLMSAVLMLEKGWWAPFVTYRPIRNRLSEKSFVLFIQYPPDDLSRLRRSLGRFAT